MRTPVYCPSCREFWWSLDDGIVGMECGLGAQPGVVRLATRDEVEAYYAAENHMILEGWSGLT